MKKAYISSMKKTLISNTNNLRDQQRLKQSSKRCRLERRVQTLRDAWRWRQQRCLSADETDCSRHQVQTPRIMRDLHNAGLRGRLPLFIESFLKIDNFMFDWALPIQTSSIRKCVYLKAVSYQSLCSGWRLIQ